MRELPHNVATHQSTECRLDGHLIMACGPYGFQGASQIMCNALWLFAALGAETVYVGHHVPFAFEHFGARGVKICVAPPVRSAAIGQGAAVASHDVLSVPVIGECIAREIMNRSTPGKKIVIWGHYLLPYGAAAASVPKLLPQSVVRPQLWLTPTGSDIWEIGPQLARTTEMLLSGPEVSRLITYTHQFADEIRAQFPTVQEIECILPCLDLHRFSPPTEWDPVPRRLALGISPDSFVITSHSNMRPVKRPEDVIAIADTCAKLCERPVTLVMIGPRTETQRGRCANLTVVETGVLPDVVPYLHISDAELNCSTHDSFNLSLAEAMACGVPCVSTDVVGISKEIGASGGGHLFSPTEPLGEDHSAVNFLLGLARSNKKRRDIGCKGSLHIREILSPEAIGKHYRSLLE